MTGLPLALAAPSPTWTRSADVIVVGSGVAGLSTALAAAATRRVLLITKGGFTDSATVWAQGGIADALGEGDSPHLHHKDTVTAGAGLCDDAAVDILVTEGPARLQELARLGAAFDRDGEQLALTREGGHGRNRIVHAGGDATGREVHRALAAAVLADPRIEILTHVFALDVLVAQRPTRQAVGLVVAAADGTVGTVTGRAVVLATGGLGQIFPSTTNPPVATGDGLALGLRAGATVADLEFVQFHPTVFWQPGDVLGQRLLVTEAIRGEGAVLVDAAGSRVMTGVHPLGDLAPRDVVTKAMTARMAQAGGEHLWLDATGLDAALLERRFPTVLAGCRAAGVDPVLEPIPVAPAAHYASGGVCTDFWGCSSLPGLYAAGETAFVGVHGANRLASNSLLEGLVYGTRIGTALALELPVLRQPPADLTSGAVVPGTLRDAIVDAVGAGAGVLRTGSGLAWAGQQLSTVAGRAETLIPQRGARQAAWEATNLLTVGTALVAAAARRAESRGCHWRQDAPRTSPAWQGHLVGALGAGGAIDLDFCRAWRAAA